MNSQTPNIQLLLTGNEIMSGDTVDSNSAMVAQAFGESDGTVTVKGTRPFGPDVEASFATESDLFEELVFGERTSVVVDPSEEKLKSEL